MGNVLGAKPSLKSMQDFVTKHWNHVSLPIVQYFKKGWFSFRFASMGDMHTILRDGPWTLGQNSLILKQWYPTFSQEMERVSCVPIWVLFPDLDPFLWTETILSKMASKIGKPLFDDYPTTMKTRLSFARVLVEVDIAAELPKIVVIKTPFQDYSVQRIHYEWLPYHCKSCGKLGHEERTCKFNRNVSKPPNAMKSKVVAPHKKHKKVFRPVSQPATQRQQPAKDGTDSGCKGRGGISAGSKGGSTETHKDSGSECCHLGLCPSESQLSCSIPPSVRHSGPLMLGQFPPFQGTVLSVKQGSLNSFSGGQGLGGTSGYAANLPTLPFWGGGSGCPLLGPTRLLRRGGKLAVSSVMHSGSSGSRQKSQCLAIQQTITYTFLSNRFEVLSFAEVYLAKGSNAIAIEEYFNNYEILTNCKSHYNGRIWCIWDPVTIHVEELHQDAQHIFCKVKHFATGNVVWVSVVYGFNTGDARSDLWSHLRRTSLHQKPLLTLGDFNVVRDINERIGPNPPDLEDIMAFNECIVDAGLEDINGTGCLYTWTNK
ncbi:uncharacterized protein LOC141629027 [Silene latifolia]|uniref:uncharacterized protein LOC141629027 n=1 Tax=Silene latifolia TaxID=37657 RepID=UPI003D77F9BB